MEEIILLLDKDNAKISPVQCKKKTDPLSLVTNPKER